MRTSVIVKIAAGLAAFGVFAFLFMRSLGEERATPYTVDSRQVRAWTLVLEPDAASTEPMLALRSSPELASDLFKQVFARAMESLASSTAPAVPAVLRSEFDQVVRRQMTAEALFKVAQAAGLEAATMTPRCLVHRRLSEPGNIRQAYLLLFDAPAIMQFRKELGVDADSSSPLLFVAGAGSSLDSWLTQRVDPETGCLVPVVVQ